MSAADQEVVAKFNRLARTVLRQRNDVLFWKTRRYICAYTPWKQPDGKFHALKYRVTKDGKQTLVKDLAFARRNVARARAYQWYQQAKAKEKPLAQPKEKSKPTLEQKLAHAEELFARATTRLKRASTQWKKARRKMLYYRKLLKAQGVEK